MKNKESLLEQAKKVTKKQNKSLDSITKEQEELALAWVKDDVTLSQVMSVLGYKTPSGVYVFLALALKKHYKGVKND